MQPSETGYVLVIAEKPDASSRIASALGPARREKIFGAEFLEIERGFDGKHYVVCGASGHLYGLADPARNRRIFPVFDVDWFPLMATGSKNRVWSRSRFRATSHASYSFASRKIQVFDSLARKASQYVHACDYDPEGETIGANIIRYAGSDDNRISVLRAKFSTLTADEIRNAFSTLVPPNPALAEAGRMRHLIDFVWGVNVSRALAESVRASGGGYQMLTMGRVQGPTLGFVVKREIEVMTHVPLPYWTMSCTLRKDGVSFVALYEISRISTKMEADRLFGPVSEAKEGKVMSLTEETHFQPPPFPFNTGDFQKEAFRIMHLSPSVSLKIAERLYLRALISYPRTDSQKLPPSIGYSKIFEGLSRIQTYGQIIREITSETVNRSIKPRQGPQDDPAHPAIFPTGEIPKDLDKVEMGIFDLITRRFLAAFSQDSSSRVTECAIDITDRKFLAFGESVKEQGWLKAYPYPRAEKKSELPKLAVSDRLELVDSNLLLKHDEKPPRYTESSLISKMASEGIGTKATRAETVTTLASREYVSNDRSLMPTETGMILFHSMNKYCPDIVEPKMTKRLEESIENISQGKESSLVILREAIESLGEVLKKLEENQIQIGLEFVGSAEAGKGKRIRITKKSPAPVSIGKCPVCGKGDLIVIRSFRTGKRFIGCSDYKNGCKTSAPLPQKGTVRSSNSTCKECNWPQVEITIGWYRSKGGAKGAPWRLCPNPLCPSKNRK